MLSRGPKLYVIALGEIIYDVAVRLPNPDPPLKFLGYNSLNYWNLLFFARLVFSLVLSYYGDLPNIFSYLYAIRS